MRRVSRNVIINKLPAEKPFISVYLQLVQKLSPCTVMNTQFTVLNTSTFVAQTHDAQQGG